MSPTLISTMPMSPRRGSSVCAGATERATSTASGTPIAPSGISHPGNRQEIRMSVSLMLPILPRIAAVTLMTQIGLTATGAAPRQESVQENIREGFAGQAQTQPTRTGKERLGGKASDPQRVD